MITLRAVAVALLAALFIPLAYAQSYPSKPIRFIVPFPPGGGNDLLARELAQYLAEPLGQTVIVDNRPGASTIIGTELAAKAPADGHTLFMGNNSTLCINPNLYKKLPYDAVKDFAPISLLAGEMFNLMARVKMVHIPYKGAGPAMVDLIAGHIELGFNNVLSALPHVRSGRLRALAVTSAVGSTPEVLAKTIDEDIARWGRVIKQTGLSLETPR